MNILFYLKMIQELETMKSLLFNENQIRLIDFISRTTIGNDVEKINEDEMIEKKLDNDKEIGNILDTYENILSGKKLGDFDVKLVKMMNCELKDLMK